MYACVLTLTKAVSLAFWLVMLVVATRVQPPRLAPLLSAIETALSTDSCDKEDVPARSDVLASLAAAALAAGPPPRRVA